MHNVAEQKKESFWKKYQKNSFFAWQRSTLPEPCGSSTIDAGGLNGRVRDGNAWFPSAIVTKRDVSARKHQYLVQEIGVPAK
jgi:hypothetical protein